MIGTQRQQEDERKLERVIGCQEVIRLSDSTFVNSDIKAFGFVTHGARSMMCCVTVSQRVLFDSSWRNNPLPKTTMTLAKV